MKLTEAIRTRAHLRGENIGRIFQLHGERFYDRWDDIYGLFNVELLQLGRYALEVQNSETENNMVSRNTTNPEKYDIYAQTSGVFHFSPEKTRGAEERSLPPLLGQGGFKPFLPQTPLPALTYTNDKARTDHSGQPPNHDSKEYDGREHRADPTLICYARPAGRVARHEDAGYDLYSCSQPSSKLRYK